MSDEKKVTTEEEAEIQDVNLEDLSEVTGGSIENVSYTGTVPISEDTKGKV
ncbi:MAG: hypothetical protein MR413_01075 [Clostridia bacterium]|nr:hypothetical protein [Clostridia bacterium]